MMFSKTENVQVELVKEEVLVTLAVMKSVDSAIPTEGS
jgi:hypothetical protein